jgi:hypothetical protein
MARINVNESVNGLESLKLNSGGQIVLVIAPSISLAIDSFEKACGEPYVRDDNHYDPDPSTHEGAVLIAVEVPMRSIRGNELLVVSTHTDHSIIQAGNAISLALAGGIAAKLASEECFECIPEFYENDDTVSAEFKKAVMEIHEKVAKDYELSWPNYSVGELTCDDIRELVFDPEEDINLSMPDVQHSEDAAEQLMTERLDDGMEMIKSALGLMHSTEEEDEISDEVELAYRAAISVEMDEQDTSDVTRLLGFNEVMLIHPGRGLKGYEDALIQCQGNTGSASGVILDDNFLNMLAALNISGKEYADYIEENYVESLYEGSQCSDDEYQTLLDLKRGDQSSPSTVPVSEVAEWLDNCNGYGMFTIATRVRMSELIELYPKERIQVLDGQIGIFESINGSGYLTPLNGKIDVSFNASEWRLDGDEGYSADSTFGFTRDALGRGEIRRPEKDKLLRETFGRFCADMEEKFAAGGYYTPTEDGDWTFGRHAGSSVIRVIESQVKELGIKNPELPKFLSDEQVTKIKTSMPSLFPTHDKSYGR